MLFGQSFSSGFGEPDHCLAGMDAAQDGAAINIILYSRTGFGDDYFGIYLNCQLMQTVFLADGATSQTICVPTVSGNVSIQAISNGWCDSIDQSDVSRCLDSETSPRATVRWNFAYEVLPSTDTDGTADTELTNWVLSGLTPYMGTVASPTRRAMPVTLTVTAGIATVSINAGNTTITGTGPVGTILALSDGAGVTGLVTVDAGAASNTKNLIYRYPLSTKIYRDGVLAGTVAFAAAVGGSFTDTAQSMGTYQYTLKDFSDTGVLGTATAPINIQINVPPEPIEDLVYSSGDQSATVITWTASPTPNVIYNVYLRKIGQTHIDTIEPYTSVLANSALLTNVGVSGVAEVIVRVESLVSTLEEKNPFILEMEYDGSGNYVQPRPNCARVVSAANTGLSASLSVLYPSTGEKGVATTVKLFSRTLSGSYNYASPDDTETLTGTTDKTATLSANYAIGWRAFVVRACTAAGVLSGVDSQESVLYISDAVTTPTNVTVTASRG